MKSRQRLLAAIRGEATDRVPWSPFLAYYWEHLPLETQKMGQFEYLRQMGADPLLRGFHTLYRCDYNNCEIEDKVVGRESFRTFRTPVGTLTERSVRSDMGNTWFLVDHPVKTAEDFKVLQYIHEHMTIVPDMERFNADMKQFGDDALMLPLLGVHCKTAFQTLVEHWVGTVDLTYALYDEPEVVEECLAVMQARDEETVRISVDSDADGFIFWEDSSTTNISPSFFEKYTKPEIDRWGDLVHNNGKLLIHHACGHLKDLIPLMGQSNIDAIESISPPPTGNVTLQEAAAILPEHIALIGGLEPVRLLSGSVEDVRRDAEELLRDLEGRRFVLANSDSCPPGVAYEKFLAVTELARQAK
jgi:uroporphyrinogen-III decarboxylase